MALDQHALGQWGEAAQPKCVFTPLALSPLLSESSTRGVLLNYDMVVDESTNFGQTLIGPVKRSGTS
jgi:hypothetical protein